MLGGLYLGQLYLGHHTAIIILYRADAPAIKKIETSYRYNSSIYDEVGAYDSDDTYDGSETVQDQFSNLQDIEALVSRAPLIKHVSTTYRFASSFYDEISEYDSNDTYDGSEVVQTSSGNDILVHIPGKRV